MRRVVIASSGRRAGLASGIIGGALLVSFASCATNMESPPADDDVRSSVPEAAAPELDAAHAEADATDAVVDAGCDPADPGCTAEVISCDTVEWCLVQTPASPFHALTAVCGSSKDDVWAVGAGGTVLHYDGATWTAIPSGFKEVFYNVWGSGPNDVWIVSHTGLVLHGTGFEDGTAVWTNTPPTLWSNAEVPSLRPIRALWGSSADDVRMATYPFYSYAYSWDGEFYFGGDVNQLVKTTPEGEGGYEWRALPGSEHFITSIWGSSATDVWMTADNGGSERGMTLHGTPGPRPNPRIDESYDCFGCEPECTSCAIADDLVWTPVESQTSGVLESVWGSSASDVWAVGYGGAIRRFATSDVRWQVVASPTTQTLHHVWGSGPNDVWFVGDQGTILHYDGKTIEPSSVQLPLGPKPALHGIWGSGPNDVWIVGDGATLHYTGRKQGSGRK